MQQKIKIYSKYGNYISALTACKSEQRDRQVGKGRREVMKAREEFLVFLLRQVFSSRWSSRGSLALHPWRPQHKVTYNKMDSIKAVLIPLTIIITSTWLHPWNTFPTHASLPERFLPHIQTHMQVITALVTFVNTCRRHPLPHLSSLCTPTSLRSATCQ